MKTHSATTADLFAAMPGSLNPEQEPTVARTKDAVRSGVGGRYVYRLSNGAIVHPKCREAYAKKHATPYKYPSIEAGLHEGYPLNRFQLCDHCQTPIWEGAELAAGYEARESQSGAGSESESRSATDSARIGGQDAG